MSRIGKQPVSIPDNVQVGIEDRMVTISGPKGSLSFEHHPLVSAKIDQQANLLYKKNSPGFLGMLKILHLKILL